MHQLGAYSGIKIFHATVPLMWCQTCRNMAKIVRQITLKKIVRKIRTFMG